MKYFAIFLILISWSYSTPYLISNVSASCIVNSDWPEAPCLDQIINGRYDQDAINRWSEYYSYKGSIFMEQKYTEMKDAIDENRLQEWKDESMQNNNVYQYYFFSGRAPNTGEYHGQFDTINVNEEGAPEYGKLTYPNAIPSDDGYIIPVIVTSAVVCGAVFVVWKKRK